MLEIQNRGQEIVSTNYWDTPHARFSVAVDRRQVDRKIEAGRCVLSVWTRVGKILELPCEVRT